MDSALVTGLAALFGAVTGSLGSLGIHLVTQRNENKRQTRALAVNAAIAEYTVHEEWKRFLMSHSGGEADVYPLADNIALHLPFFEYLLDGKAPSTSTEELVALLAGMQSREEELKARLSRPVVPFLRASKHGD